MSIDIGLRGVLSYFDRYPSLLVIILISYLALAFLATFLFNFVWAKKGINPLTKDFRRQQESCVHDAKRRNAVLKDRFKTEKVPENLDAIIIGSGIGGLTAGVLLARAGKRVLVLEQHDQAGGCCHTFLDKGFAFDTGIHYIGELQETTVYRILIDQLTSGQITWSKLDDAYDTIIIGHLPEAQKFQMLSGKNRLFQNLVDLFPKEKEAIHAYKSLIEDAVDSFSGILGLKVLPYLLVRFLVVTRLHHILLSCYRKRLTSRTLQDVLDQLTDNLELKLVLSYCCPDYGVLPKDVPFILHAFIMNHFVEGAYYPANGPSEIVYHMVEAIRSEGGAVLTRAPVSQILCSAKGRAIGVEIQASQNVQLYAKYIISDAGLANTFQKMLPPEVAKKSRVNPLLQEVGASCSFLTTFVGFEGSSSQLGLPAGNIWLYQRGDINQTVSDYLSLSEDEFYKADIPFAFISFPSAKDAEWEQKFPGKSTAQIITLSNFEWFSRWQAEISGPRGDHYKGIKEDIGRKMLQSVVDLLPQLEGRMTYLEVGTPLSNKFYLACPKGEIYGLNQARERFTADVVSKLRPDSDIKGLFLTGQDMLICGFVPGLMTGMLCASKILNRNLFNDLDTLKQRLFS